MVERERKIKTQKKNLAKPGIWSLVLAVLSLTVPNGYAGLPWWLGGKEPTFQCRRPRLDPWVGKYRGKGNGNLLQYSCLGNPLDRGAWWVTVHGITKELDIT